MARVTAKFSITAEDKTKQAFRSVTSGIDNLERKFLRLATPITGLASAAGFGALIKKTAEQGDLFDKMSARTGIAVEKLSGLSYAADITGTSIDSVERSLKYLSQQMLDVSRGTGESKKTFDALGISVTDTGGNLRITTDVLREVADKLSVMDDETKMAGYAMEIFGSRAGQGLIPMLKLGGRGIDELTKKNKELGGEWTALETGAAAKFNDALTDLKGAAGGLGRAIAMELIPGLTDGAERMAEWIAKNREFLRLEFKDKLGEVRDVLDTLSEHKDVIGTAIGAAFIATHVTKLTKLATVLWSIAAAKEYIMSRGKGAPISERFLQRIESQEFTFGGGGARGGMGAGGGFGDELNLNLPTEPTPGQYGMKLSSFILPEMPSDMLDLEREAWDKTYEDLIKSSRQFEDQRHSIWLRGMENRIRLDYDGIEQQKELLKLWYEDEFGMLEDQDERKLLAKKNLHMELELLERDHIERMIQENESAVYRFGSTWGGMLFDMQERSGNTFDNIASEFGRMVKRMSMQAAAAGLFNLATNMVTGGFWGGVKAFVSTAVGLRGDGGPVEAGKAYVVGERGQPELFVPKTSGTIIPTSKAAGGTVDNRRVTINAAWISETKPSAVDLYTFADMLVRADDLGLLEKYKKMQKV